MTLTYLLPAGYEFQKIASDFQRLIEGKALFDGHALEAIVDAVDNNVRAEALEAFAENVLPMYDDPRTEYPQIVEALIEAATRAKETLPTAIETPFGSLPAKTLSNIVEAIAEILTRYRYLDVGWTFDGLRALYCLANGEMELKPLLESSRALAAYNIHVWRQHGPAVQGVLLERVEGLSDEERRRIGSLLVTTLGAMLSTEVTGTTGSSSAVTFHHGSVTPSEALGVVRAKAINQLKHQFALADGEGEIGAVLLALQVGTRRPMGGTVRLLRYR